MSNKEIVYWKTKDGKKVSIDDMDTNHLKNVLKMIVNNSNKHRLKVLSQKHKFKLNGDIANEFNMSFDEDE
jgi:hypothetical protein